MSQTSDNPEQAVGRWSEIFSGRYGVYTLILNLGMTLFAINQFVVTTIMPTVVADLGGLDYYTWTFSLFAVGAIIGAASAGPIRDAFGIRRAYAGAGLMLGIGLAGAGFATDMPTVVGFRLLQGIGGGALASQAYGLVSVVYPSRLRPRVLGIVSTVWGIATVIGPGFGGVFAEMGLWREAFWTLVPFAVLFAYLALRYVEGDAGHGRLSELPYWRLAFLALAVLLMSATSLVDTNVPRVILVVASIAVAAYALIRDKRSERNMFPRQVASIRTELGAIYWIIFLVSVVMAFFYTYSTFYLQILHGITPFVAGYLFAVQSFLWTGSALMVTSWRSSRELTAVFIGLALLVFSSTAIAFTVVSGPVILIAIAIGLNGMGIGFLNNPAIQRIMAVAPEAEQHIAGTSVQAIRNIGISFGAAASGLVAAAAGLTDGADKATVAHAMTWVYSVNVAFSALGLLVVIVLVMRRRTARA